MEDTISPKLQAIVDKIQGITGDIKKFGEQIAAAFRPSTSAWSEAFSSLGSSAENARTRASRALTDLWENSLAPFASYIVLEWVPDITNTFSETFAPIFADVMPVVMDAWATDFENGCILISDLCITLQDAFEGVKTAFSDMCASISSNWDTYGGALLQGFSDFKEGLWETWWYIYDNIISPVVDACSETLSWLWDKHLKPLWDNVVEFAMSVGENIMALWNGFLKPIVDYVVAYIAPVISNAIGLIVDAVSVAAAFIADIVGSILKYLDGIIQFVTGVFTLDWERAWGGISKMFEGVWNGLSGVVKGATNAIIWVINALVASIYSAIASIVNGLGSIVSNIGGMLGQNWGFSVPTVAPKIPYLAQGAVLPANKPFLAMVGDQKNGTNIEAPLDTIKQAVSEVMGGTEQIILIREQNRLLQEILENSGVYLDGKKISETVTRYQRYRNRALGI